MCGAEDALDLVGDRVGRRIRQAELVARLELALVRLLGAMAE